MDTDVNSNNSLFSSDIMISDWSGAALEYAFALKRPVLFIDIPRKINNPNYEELRLEPLEVTIRDEIGSISSPKNLDGIAEKINRLFEKSETSRKKVENILSEIVFNLGKSGKVGAEYILKIAKK